MFDGTDTPGFVADLRALPFIGRMPWAGVCQLTQALAALPRHKTIAHAFGLYAFAWYRAGFSGKPAARVTGKALRELGIANRVDKQRALILLERTGLVRVKRAGNRSPVVILLQPEPLPKSGAASAPTRYGRRWCDFRAAYLRDNPDCGCGQAATIVDHVHGRSEDILVGPFQAMCRPCHGRKSASERWSKKG